MIAGTIGNESGKSMTSRDVFYRQAIRDEHSVQNLNIEQEATSLYRDKPRGIK